LTAFVLLCLGQGDLAAYSQPQILKNEPIRTPCVWKHSASPLVRGGPKLTWLANLATPYLVSPAKAAGIEAFQVADGVRKLIRHPRVVLHSSPISTFRLYQAPVPQNLRWSFWRFAFPASVYKEWHWEHWGLRPRICG
jgi:hypothetical protein